MNIYIRGRIGKHVYGGVEKYWRLTCRGFNTCRLKKKLHDICEYKKIKKTQIGNRKRFWELNKEKVCWIIGCSSIGYLISPWVHSNNAKEKYHGFWFFVLKHTILSANQNVGKVFLNNDIYHMTSKELTYCLFCFYVVLFFFFCIHC